MRFKRLIRNCSLTDTGKEGDDSKITLLKSKVNFFRKSERKGKKKENVSKFPLKLPSKPP